MTAGRRDRRSTVGCQEPTLNVCGMLNVRHNNSETNYWPWTKQQSTARAESKETLKTNWNTSCVFFVVCIRVNKTLNNQYMCLFAAYLATQELVRVSLPVGVLCHGRGRQRCWRRPGRWGWPVAVPPYGKGASCPTRSPWTSRTAHCGGTMGPGFKQTTRPTHCWTSSKHTDSKLLIISKNRLFWWLVLILCHKCYFVCLHS